MSMSPRERRLVMLVVPAVLLAVVLRFVLPDGTAAPANGSSEAGDISLARQRAARMRQLIATTPVRTAAFKQVTADLADRERGILPGRHGTASPRRCCWKSRDTLASQMRSMSGAVTSVPQKPWGNTALSTPPSHLSAMWNNSSISSQIFQSSRNSSCLLKNGSPPPIRS